MIRIGNFFFNTWRAQLFIGIILLTITVIVSCKKKATVNTKLPEKELIQEVKEAIQEPKVEDLSISGENLVLEASYLQILEPISALKSSNPKIYWFIVSWLGTNYLTPNWEGYYSNGWQEKTKLRGIDCSGFARVMEEEIFNKKIRGGSQGILNQYCIPVTAESLIMGDLVFFRAPGAKNNRIVHVGVYLKEGFFVHATSAKSANKGLGLNVNALNEKMWSEDFVTGGRISEQKK